MVGFIAVQGHGDVWAWASAGAHIWVQTLKQSWSLLMSMAPETTNDREDGTVQSCWPCPSLTNRRENCL